MKIIQIAALIALCAACVSAAPLPDRSRTISLDGHDWLICADPDDAGKSKAWFEKIPAEAKQGRVPGIMQETLGNYHGVGWYYKNFTVPAYDNFRNSRYYLRFWETDFKADIYVNGKLAKTHAGNEEMFLVDATKLVNPGKANLLAVRVVKPAYRQVIDDMELG
ncbi:MAG: hypothetical protein J6U98_07360, partial [Abditibacteriota bacterium]|nr:hypothetical protein [Abditibacteriota bacterium]